MLEGLFNEESEDGTAPSTKNSPAKQKDVESPPTPRSSCGLAGIKNQGATCYMNALLQTLVYTPEFREALFKLDQEELGKLEERSKPGAKVRVIPIQLQKLFASLLLVQQQSIGTQDLTDSFGWSNNEELQQHDVQELNRILFSAIEDSLVGTSGQNLISQFYHGNIVNQISCDECGRVSEREEDFLDLTLAVAGHSGVTDTLTSFYVTKERMEGDNQYRCERCNKLVNASKGAKLRSLPPILTLSLLRFSYDFNRGQRYKEMGNYSFPLELDMTPFCEKAETSESSQYELFSVVIHGGSTHGGHYHAYIRDVDGIGTWTKPEEEMIQLPKKSTDDDTTVGVIELNSPQEILALLLRQHGGPQCTLGMDELCQALSKETGVSWNKRFKKQYGPIVKFIRQNDNMFTFTAATNSVSLKDAIVACPAAVKTNQSDDLDKSSEADMGKHYNDSSDVNHRNNSGNQNMRNDDAITSETYEVPSTDIGQSDTRNKFTSSPRQECAMCCDKKKGSGDRMQCAKCRANRTHSVAGHELSYNRGKCWFDFNDSKVHPITAKAIDRQFSGRESAYMLFYRSKSLYRPVEECNRLHGIPEWLLGEVQKENERLEKQRLEYEAAINRIELVILQSHHYVYNRGALHPRPSIDVTPKKLGLDRRKTMEEFITDIKMLTEDKHSLENDAICLHIAKQLPAGLHLFNCISENKMTTLQDLNITDGTQVFVWDGRQVDGMPIRTGDKCEPVLLNITYECHDKSIASRQNGTKQIQHTFPKDCTLSEIRAMVSVLTDIPARCLFLSRVSSKPIVLETSDNNKTLQELKLYDHDSLVAEYQRELRSTTSLAEQETEKQNKMISLSVENRCAASLMAAVDWPTQQVHVAHDQKIEELKCIILDKFSLADDKMMKRVCRLRVNHDSLGLQAPLYEEETVSSAGLTSGTEIVLEPGKPPKNNQMTLTFSAKCDEHTLTHEATVERNITVGECLNIFLERANISSDAYHLRRANWCQEPAGLLPDLDATLEQENVSNGDFLILEEGKLAPRGFILLPIWLYPSPDRGQNTPEQDGIVSYITKLLEGLLSKEPTNGHQDNDILADDIPRGALLGQIEISLDATLEDLKIQILTLDALDGLALPTPDFLRVRLLENKRLTRVLREKDQTLRRQKVTRSTQVAIQVLSQDEELKTNSIVLNICQRIAQTRTYTPMEELTWEAGKAGHPENLKQIIADRMLIPVERVVMAKHLLDKFDWLVINSTTQTSPSKSGKGKKKGHRTHVVNLKHAPYHLKDGDVIGIKDLQYDSLNQDDFTTEDDDIGKEHLRLMAEEKRQRRKALKQNNSSSWDGSKQKGKRTERSLAIHVDDFRTELEQT